MGVQQGDKVEPPGDLFQHKHVSSYIYFNWEDRMASEY